MSAELSFRDSVELLKETTGISISLRENQLISEDIGREIEEGLKREVEKVWGGEEIEQIKEVPKRLYISADGTTVNTEEGWKEVKIGAVFTQEDIEDEGEGKYKVKKASYVGSFKSSEEFGKRLWVEAYRQRVEEVREKIVLGDGAKWIWNEAKKRYPAATQIVDWYHASERIWKVGKAIYGEGTETGEAWVKQRLKELKEGFVERVIESIKELKPKTEERKKEISSAITYFNNNKERMRYNEYREKGYFIGSGVVEGACKHIIGARLKQSGMKWSKEGGEAILQLRICCLNNRWDNYWKQKLKAA